MILGGANSSIIGSTGLTLQETGDTFGAVALSLQNRNGVNGAMFQQLGSVDLVDFVFKGLINQRNIRFENRGTSTFVGGPEFEFGLAADPTFVVSDLVSDFRKGTLAIGIPSYGGGTVSPLATLDVRSVTTNLPIASFSGSTSFAALVVDNSGSGALITASASGATRFVVNLNGLLLMSS